MKVMCGDRVAEHSDDGNFNSAIKCTGFIGCTLLGIFGFWLLGIGGNRAKFEEIY